MGKPLSKALADILKKIGFSICVCCPGSRNKFLLSAFLDEFECLTVFEERSAGFLSLGINKAAGRNRSFVVTTSGTAVAELFPSVIEAYYSKVQYLCITADLPARYRVGGYPQAINQKKIFGMYALFCDVNPIARKKISLVYNCFKPVHWNVSFEETDPVVDKAVVKILDLEKSRSKSDCS